MFELFKLVGRVMVDASGANQALDGTDKKAQGVTGNLGGYMAKLKGWAAAAGAAITGSAIAKGLKEIWDLSSKVAEIGDNIDKASQKFMLSRQAYQEWAFVAQRSGFEINQLGQAVVDLSKKVGEGKEDVLAVLEEIGISAADAMTATPEALFDMVIEGLQGVGESTRRAYLADKLLGGAAKDLNPLLNMSADATSSLKDEVNALGAVMSDQLVDQSAKFQDSQTNLQAAWDGVKYHLAEDTLPGMTLIIDGLTQMMTGDLGKGLVTAASGVESFLGGILGGFGRFVVGIVKETVEGIGSLAEGAAELGKMMLNPTVDTTDEMHAFLNGGQPYSAQDQNLIAELISLRQEYLAAGGSEFAFIAETTEKYGAEVADQLIAALEEGGAAIDESTTAYTASMQSATNQWEKSTANIGAASDKVVAAMESAANDFYTGSTGFSGLYTGSIWSLPKWFPHAVGLDFVPRDDYPARLHYGEQVLTKQEADDYRAGKSGGGNTTINISTVAQSPAQTAAAITAAMARARWAM